MVVKRIVCTSFQSKKDKGKGKKGEGSGKKGRRNREAGEDDSDEPHRELARLKKVARMGSPVMLAESDRDDDIITQNNTAFMLRFGKNLHESNKNETVRHVMPCKDTPWADMFMATNRKLSVQVLDAWTVVMVGKCMKDHFLWCANGEYAAEPSKENIISWQEEMDLDYVPWVEVCTTYALAIKEICPPRFSAEGIPDERFDVWLMKSCNRVTNACCSLNAALTCT